MTYRTIRSAAADQEIARLSPEPRRNYHRALRGLRRDPAAGDTKKLGGFDTLWRTRIGRWRIIFDLDTEQRTITILRVARREVVYEGLEDLVRDAPPGSQ